MKYGVWILALTFVGWLCKQGVKHLKRLDRQNELRREHARRCVGDKITADEWKEMKTEIPQHMPTRAMESIEGE